MFLLQLVQGFVTGFAVGNVNVKDEQPVAGGDADAVSGVLAGEPLVDCF